MVGKTPHPLKFRQQKGLHKGDSPGFTRGRRANRGYHSSLWDEKKEKEDTLRRVNHIFWV
jgi:hypothetical protein